MEISLVLVKPDAIKDGLIGTIIGRLEGAGLKLVALKMLHLDWAMAAKHYAVHRDKPFFNDVITYITSTPIVAAVFKGEDAIDQIRKMIGSTDPTKAKVGTIRGDFGLDIQRNVVHGSDSKETAMQEISLFFSRNEIFDY